MGVEVFARDGRPKDREISGIIPNNLRYRGGILPAEMVAFLSLCDEEHIDTVIESGRGKDAFSTQVLGEYQKVRGIKVISIDWERRLWNKLVSRYRLLSYPNVHLVVGDSYMEMPKAITRAEGNVALLVDGPKHEDAIRLLKSNVCPKVKVVALHNCTGNTWELFKGTFSESTLVVQLGMARV